MSHTHTKPRTVSLEEVMRKRPVDPDVMATHRARLDAEERAWRLRELRETYGLTQRDVAKQLGVSQPTISELESGNLTRSSLDTLTAYVAALGGNVEVSAVFGPTKFVLVPNLEDAPIRNLLLPLTSFEKSALVRGIDVSVG